MKALGHLDLNGNELQNITLQHVINFPDEAKVGSFIFKDKRVMVCVDVSGLPVWIPLTQQLSTVVFSQTVPQSTWVIPHNLNTAIASVQVVDTANKVFIPDEIDLSVKDQVTIKSEVAIAGKAIIIAGSTEGMLNPTYSFTQPFTNGTVIVVNHGLGYNPAIRVFVNNQEVQPASVVHNSTTQATITFTNPQTGIIRCI